MFNGKKAHKWLPIPIPSDVFRASIFFQRFSAPARVTHGKSGMQSIGRIRFNQILIYRKLPQLRNKRKAHSQCRSQLCKTNFLFIAIFHSHLSRSLAKMFHVFSGFHCVISFIACAKISFTIAIYFPEDFSFTTGDE